MVVGDDPVGHRGRESVFHPAGPLVGQLRLKTKDLDEEGAQGLVAGLYFPGDPRTCRGEADRFVGGVVDQPLVPEQLAGLGHRGAGHLQPPLGLPGPDLAVAGLELEDDLQVVFNAGAERFFHGRTV